MNKKILSETKRAYGDSKRFPNTVEGQLKTNKAYETRNLNFRASAPVSVPDAVKIMREALCLVSPDQDGYNNFKPSHLEMLPEGTKVILAREGSVCVYAKLPKHFNTIDARTSRHMMVDECDVQDDGTVRLWWD
jgi:hypothetical protein